MGRYQLPRIIALILLPLLSFAQDGSHIFDATDVDATAALEGKITDYQIVRLDVAALYATWRAADGHIDLRLSGSAGDVGLHLTPWELRDPDYQVTVNGDARTPRLNATHSPVYRGNVDGGGEAIFTFDEQFVLAHFEKGGRRMALEPLWRLRDGAAADLYILYDETKSVNGGTDVCETDLSQHVPTKPAPAAAQKSMGGCITVDIALVADTELYGDFNSVSSVENFMLGVLADVRTVYDDEFADEIQYEIISTTIYTNTNIDPYSNTTNASNLIGNFRAYSINNPSSIPGDYDVASMWTGRDFQGGTIGIAYVPGICGDGRYNLLENFSNSSIQLRNVWAHELGHNFNSLHDPSNAGDPVHIMFPSVSSVSTWSAASVNTIQNYYRGVSCLAICAPPAVVGEVVYQNIAAGTPNYFFDQSESNVESRVWNFPGGSPSSSGALAPEVTFDEPGNYVATLTVTNQSGSSTTQVPFVVADEGGTEVLFREDFEDNNLRVNFVNPDNDALRWEVLATDGNRGVRAARADNGTLDGSGTSDFIRSPAIGIDGVLSPKLRLQYAYVRFDEEFRDVLRVSVIQNGVKTEVFMGDEDGSGNFATEPDYSGTPGLFLPQVAEDWCFTGPACIEVDLSAFQGGGDIIVEVENDAGFGQPMYVDNIVVLGTQSQALPVEWLSFRAKSLGKTIGLEWSVNQDEENQSFDVERSVNSDGAWATIGAVPARGGAMEDAGYTFVDTDVSAGNDYQYRLRQQDVDGGESYSEIRSVTLAGDGGDALAAFPNPATDRVFVTTASERPIPYALFDATGRRVGQGSLATGGSFIPLSELATGIYTVRTEVGVVRIVRR